ncbi:Fur family transcriptional regulator [Opitutus sp. GAS368]|jgi:Fur family peroxide stress response transcriptional regulator|uniref:Fur family transcriptional regulator n=1 Tax=Opitutus sp. GAS368 TaxID=1882749 RepID=UPI00087A4139|nr:Fur family transcriptional regulator [Opitutus sp. GAS368]SDS16226.1 Fur family transcriptional regulator, peroxide stress response regulator [Opitutus sp. GAS368]
MSTTTDNHAALCERLKACDVRPTPQREVVLKVILEKRDHPTADEIFARVKASMPTISLATVYNCLEALVSGGLVRQVNLERAPTRYCPNLHEHAHFHDEHTGKIHDVDLPDDFVARLRQILPAGFDARSIELNFRGKAAAN